MSVFALCAALLAAAPTPVAFLHANVVPMDVERVLKDQTLVVVDGKVSALGPTGKVSVPPGATVVDATGKYLLPGLVLLQTGEGAADAASLARAGVTELVRLQGNDAFGWVTPADFEKRAYRQRAESAAQRGVTLLGPAPLALGFSEVVKARQSLLDVDSLVELTLIPRPPLGRWLAMALGSMALFLLALLVELSRGFIARRPASRPARVTIPLALALGLSLGMSAIYVKTFLAGLGWVPTCLVGLGTLVMLCGGWILVAAVGGRWPSLGPRLLVGLAGVAGFVFPTSLIRFLPPVERATPFGMDEVVQRCVEGPSYVLSNLDRHATELSPRRPRMQAQLLQKLGAAGLLVAAPSALTGDGFHRELRHLEDQGLSPFDVLRAATATPAAFAHRSAELGLLEVGRRADLFMTAQNPLADVSTCARPVGVMQDGLWKSDDSP